MSTELLRRLRESPMATTLATALDRGFLSLMRAQGVRGRRTNRAESHGHDERVRLLGLLAAHLRETVTGEFFRPRAPIEPEQRQVGTLSEGGRSYEIRWPSDYHCFFPDIEERYRRNADNLQGAARLWLHREPRAMAVLLHGYMAGDHLVERMLWPLDWLYRQGLDLAQFALPLHGARAVRGRRAPPAFPSSDPRFTIDGIRHVMGDLCDLVAWLRGRGHAHVGLMGMSLGGYTACLGATVEPTLSFLVPVIPLASIADFARAQGRLGSTPAEQAAQHAALEAVYAVVSPLGRAPLIAGRRVMVVAGAVDRITPSDHARVLAEHFDAPVVTWPGGHLLQLGRLGAYRQVVDRLRALDLLG